MQLLQAGMNFGWLLTRLLRTPPLIAMCYIFSGYEIKNSKGEREIETSNGIIMVDRFDIEQLECLGVIQTNFEVQVYDFLAHGITSDYDGVIGLDFLKKHKFCIDLKKGEITIDI